MLKPRRAKTAHRMAISRIRPARIAALEPAETAELSRRIDWLASKARWRDRRPAPRIRIVTGKE
jgi:hypothetical protein